MKRPRIFIMLSVLLLALLIPMVYQGGLGTHTHLQSQPQTNENGLAQNESGALSVSSGVQKNSGENETSPDKAKVSNSSSSSHSSTKIPTTANAGDTIQFTAGSTAAVVVVGKTGEMLFGPADVKLDADKPANALSVLASTGLPYIMSARFPDLVISIADQQNQGQSGWMYKVNNEIPGVSAAQKSVSEGDRVIWWYSLSLDVPSPEWGSLSK